MKNNYVFLRNPTAAFAPVENMHAAMNAYDPSGRGVGQTVVEEIDYLDHVKQVPECQFTKASRRSYQNRIGPLARQVAKRQQVLQARLVEQRQRQMADYRARLYGEGKASPPKRYRLRSPWQILHGHNGQIRGSANSVGNP